MLEAASSDARRQLGLALLLVISGALLAALTPLALKWLVDTVGAPGSPASENLPPSPAILVACYVAAVCGSRVLTELRGLAASAAEQKIGASLNRRFFGHLLALPLAFHLERRTGAVIHGLYQATAGCQLIISTILATVVPVVVETVAVIAIMVRLDQPLLVAILATTAIACLAAFGIAGPPYRRRARDLSGATMDLHAVLNDNLVNIETIKSFGAETVALARFASATAGVECRWRALHRQRAMTGLAIAAILAVSVTASLLISVRAVAEGALTLGGFVMATVYMLQVVRPLEMVGSALRDLSQAMEFVRPQLDVLDRPAEASLPMPAPGKPDTRHETPKAGNAAAARARPPEIRFDQVRFAYAGSPPALDGVDLHIPPGRSIGIVGASGSGKSTLARLLLRLYHAQAGTISLDGSPIDAMPLSQLRARFGVVSQDTVLFNDTIAFNIAMGDPRLSMTRIEAAARLAQLHDFIVSTPGGYGTLVGERGLKLSGGERQRLAIARAVIRQPSIFIFDEATSMLDGETEASLLSSLRAASAGCTTITIAHRLSTARHADEIVVLSNGRIAERGSHAELLDSGGEYARLWQMQPGAGAP